MQRTTLAAALSLVAYGAVAQVAAAPFATSPARECDDGTLSPPKYAVRLDSNVRIPMRDGVTLSADIYRPDARGRFPAILLRTPYGRTSGRAPTQARWFAERGYVFIRQDVRGRYDSDGTFYPFINEADDGYDTDEWIGKQAWFDSNLGTVGSSYVGYVQWAQAVRGSKYLKAIAPSVTTGDVYGNWIYIDGALHYGFALPWGGVTIDGRVNQFDGDFDWSAIYPHLPIGTSDEASHHRTPHYRDWLAHPRRDDLYWDRSDLEGQYERIAIPILSVDGWYDIFLRGALADDAAVKRVAHPAARAGKRLVIGPWAHGTGTRYALTNGRVGSTPPDPVDFGATAALDMDRIYLRWFDHWLKGIDNGVDRDAPVEIFVMGENRWRSEREWPLARTVYTNYYLTSGGHANSAQGDGRLGTAPPHGAATDSFAYDPVRPVPSMGGNVCCSTVPSGPWDQRAVERRDDVLVFTTTALDRPLEITGPLSLKLYAASSASDTDWTAKLVDVHPDGFAQNIQSGIVRARHRNGVRAAPTLIQPGKVYAYTIDLWATSYLLRAGHRLRLEVSSSDFPRFDRNLNTGEEPATGTRWVTAKQTVYHDTRYPSHLVLPVIPRPAADVRADSARDRTVHTQRR